MTVILTPWKNQLLRRCSAAGHIRLICPFIKVSIARSIVANARPGAEISLVTRNKPSDFAAGVSDIEALKVFFAAEELGIGFSLFVNNTVHAKVFIFDDDVCYVGSSNLTAAGLERSLEGTVEITDRAAVANWAGVHALMRSKAKPVSARDLFGFESATLAYSSRHRVEKTDEGRFYAPAAGQADAGQADEGTAAVYVSAEEREHPVSPAFQDRLDDLVDARFPDTPSVEEAFDETIPPVEVPPGPESTGQDNEPTAPPETVQPSGSAKSKKASQALRAFASLIDNLFGIPHWVGPASSAHVLVHPSSVRMLADTEIEGRSLEVDKSMVSALNQLGMEAFLAATSIIAARSGLLTRYGPAFNSVVTNAFRTHGFLPKAWRRHLLPDPALTAGAGFSVEESPAARRRMRLEAAHRLLGVGSLAKGQNDFVEFVETDWNPLVEYGSDIVEFSLAKDPKTKMQEICALLGIDHSYTDHAVTGTDHQPEWSCTLTVGKWEPVQGAGTYKQAAEADAIAKFEATLADDPRWQRAEREYRKKTFASYTSPGPWPLRYRRTPGGHIPERMEAAAAGMALPLPPAVLYGCLVNRQIRQKTDIDFDNSPLAQIGSNIARWQVTQWLVETGRTEGHGVLANALLPRLSAAAGMEKLYEAAGLKRYVTEAFMNDAFQSVVASLVLFGPEGSASAFVRQALAKVDMGSILGVDGGNGFDAKYGPVQRGLGPFDARSDYITLLQEIAQRVDKQVPDYEVARVGGPDHMPTFGARVTWNGWSADGTGSSAKTARRNAAHALLAQWKDLDLATLDRAR